MKQREFITLMLAMKLADLPENEAHKVAKEFQEDHGHNEIIALALAAADEIRTKKDKAAGNIRG